MQFSNVNCFRGLSSWLSARFSTLLMLAGVGALRHCTDEHLQAISRFDTDGHVSFFYLKVSFH